ncbi:MAG: hypothetical protein ACXVDA_16085 [Ktedonobacterales bacterium]
MAAEDQTSEPGAGVRGALPWWDVRRPGTLHRYVGLCWISTPVALIYLHGLLGQHSGAGLMAVGLVWVVEHVALVYCVLRLHLIQRSVGRLLFVAAVMLASAAVGGIALLIFIPDTLSVSDLQLLVRLPQLHAGALALLALSATRSAPRPSTPHA